MKRIIEVCKKSKCPYLLESKMYAKFKCNLACAEVNFFDVCHNKQCCDCQMEKAIAKKCAYTTEMALMQDTE